MVSIRSSMVMASASCLAFELEVFYGREHYGVAVDGRSAPAWIALASVAPVPR